MNLIFNNQNKNVIPLNNYHLDIDIDIKHLHNENVDSENLDNKNTNIDLISKSEYRTSKCSLDSITKNKKSDTKSILCDAVLRTHKIVTNTYEFLRLWILKKYYDSLKENETKITLPIITIETIKAAFKTFIKEKETDDGENENKTEKDNNMQYEKIRLCEEFLKFYNDECKDLQFCEKVDGIYLTQIQLIC